MQSLRSVLAASIGSLILPFPIVSTRESEESTSLPSTRSLSLDRHIRLGWSIFNHELGEFIECVPPQQRNVDRWYRGTADSIFQNIYLLQRERPERVLILSGDHVYKMNYNDMLAFHMEKNADLTVAAVEVDQSEARAFGVIGVDEEGRIIDWAEKPAEPKTIPGKPGRSLASMGVYIFNTEALVKNVIADAKNPASSHDFGKDVVPRMMKGNRVYVHSFTEPNNPEGRYWRDIGTIDAYWEANMDICSVEPQCNLYDPKWPIRSYQEQVPPARIVSCPTEDICPQGVGALINSMISGGCVVYGGTVVRSVLSPNVRIDPGAVVEDWVLLAGVHVCSGARVRKAIIDQEVEVPAGYSIGHDPEFDQSRFTISPGGVAILPKGMVLR